MSNKKSQQELRREVYLKVIDSTIEATQAEFQREGIDASILEDLAARWQTRLQAEEEELEGGGHGDEDPDANQEEAEEADGNIPQNDGANDDGDEAAAAAEDAENGEDGEEDGEEDGSEGPEKKKAKVDPEDSDEELFGPEPDTSNHILAQHDKVTKKQNRWKVTLRDCVVRIDGEGDLLFKNLACEWKW
mmetsp:Transcript_2243/g.6697  ORF Transcript_2243/g.6697 Transcript_2243/m.6697 type:complete len:190 (+) Transcript_2243:321-890(+)